MKPLSKFVLTALLGGIALLGTGCLESDSKPYGSSHDFGENNRDVYVCIGDSMTRSVYGVTPYPEFLANMLDKTVINEGVGGERVPDGAARTAEVLNRHRPGYLLIMHGINDVETQSPEYIVSHLRAIVRTAKNQQVLPVISSITPFVGRREHLNVRVDAVNRMIRAMAAEEDVRFVDCERVIRGRSEYVLEDGFHFSELGSFAIAFTWADRL